MAKKTKTKKPAKAIPTSVNSQITDSVTQSAFPTAVNDQITDAITQAASIIKGLKDFPNNGQITDSVTQLIRGIKNSFTRFFAKLSYVTKWIPHLWNNYWWDHSTLDAMLMYELRYRANRFRDFGMCEGADAIAEEMDLVADALDDCLSSKLENEFTTDWEAKHPGFFKKTFEELAGKKQDKKDEALSKLFVKEYTAVVDKQYKLRREALMLLAEKSENWWD